MTWMPTWQQFLEVTRETCVASWVEQKARPNSQPKAHEYCCIKESRSDFMKIKHILVVPRWDLGTHVKRP
jgi:hypothetical protein